MHTPGPWNIRTEGTMTGRGPEIFADGAYYDDGSEFVIAQLFSADADVIDANARLIAAAPELLEALKGALALLDAQDVFFEADGTRHNIWHRAVDKAEGR
jgi:hypothetical protein